MQKNRNFPDQVQQSQKRFDLSHLLVISGLATLFGLTVGIALGLAIDRATYSFGQRELNRLALAVSSYNLDAGIYKQADPPAKFSLLTTPIVYLNGLPSLADSDWLRVHDLPTAGVILSNATATPSSLAFDCGCEEPETEEDKEML